MTTAVPRRAFLCVIAQHSSSAWSEQCLEFAAYLFLIVIFPTTLIPASALGLAMTGGSLVMASTIGGMVDTRPKLRFAREMIVVQKLCQVAVYTCFWSLFRTTRSTARDVVQVALLVVAATVGRLATNGIDLAVDRDWVLIASAGDTPTLTRFNSWNRRAFLACKLLAPLGVSSVATRGYTVTTLVLLGVSIATCAVELVWIGVVWRAWPQLADAPSAPREDSTASSSDLVEFSRLPVFLSSLAVSSLYLTTLSFDGIMLSWLKAQRGLGDVTIAWMRGVCVVTGLAGTLVMPRLERWMGLARAGAWSIWFEIACLVPVLLMLDSPALLFFPFLALSRIGLYAFDLVQLQQLQTELEHHPRRNRFMALQISMESAFDLGKYGVVLVWNRPEQFWWTALVSFASVAAGGVVYSTYLRMVRGHLVHWPHEVCDGKKEYQQVEMEEREEAA